MIKLAESEGKAVSEADFGLLIKEYCDKKDRQYNGTSLAVQWLRLHASNGGVTPLPSTCTSLWTT